MKRLVLFCILLSILILATALCQTAIDPDDYAGQWYSIENQNNYQFSSGLITCSKHAVKISDTESVSGAYTYCSNSVFLFAKGIDGLETGKELYLIQNGEGDFLCENEDGTGRTYFARYCNQK